MDSPSSTELLRNPGILRDHIRQTVGIEALQMDMTDAGPRQFKQDSVVLFVLSSCPESTGRNEPCLILNKRSLRVRQGGDLCCPGGGLSWPTDRWLARLLILPGSPLKRWARRSRRGDYRGTRGRALALLLAAGLREAWEEMRLNPFRVTFLGMLPQQRLVMFKRVIHPLVGWASVQPFKPNWEVERVVSIPLRHLLDPTRYRRFRPVLMPGNGDGERRLRHADFPCFIHEDGHGRELLWGATYRITESFLEQVFHFTPPEMHRLPVVHRQLDDTYLNGSRWHPGAADRKDSADW